MYFPGHTGFHGNESADCLASSAPINTILNMGRPEILQEIIESL